MKGQSARNAFSRAQRILHHLPWQYLLAEIVRAISHTKDNYLSAQYHRLARRIGKTKTIVAVSHTVAVNFYHMITKRLPYRELGANYFDTLDRERLTKHTVKRLEALGYEVTLTPKEVSA